MAQQPQAASQPSPHSNHPFYIVAVAALAYFGLVWARSCRVKWCKRPLPVLVRD